MRQCDKEKGITEQIEERERERERTLRELYFREESFDSRRIGTRDVRHIVGNDEGVEIRFGPDPCCGFPPLSFESLPHIPQSCTRGKSTSRIGRKLSSHQLRQVWPS